MNQYVLETISIYIEIRKKWFSSEIRQLITVSERQDIDYRFTVLSRYIQQHLLTIQTAEMFMQKVIRITTLIFSYYPRFGVAV